MPVTLTFSCGGCDATAEGTRPLRSEFRSLSGQTHGLGSQVLIDRPGDLAPEGWIGWDPYTGCCYCPACWARIGESTDD